MEALPRYYLPDEQYLGHVQTRWGCRAETAVPGGDGDAIGQFSMIHPAAPVLLVSLISQVPRVSFSLWCGTE